MRIVVILGLLLLVPAGHAPAARPQPTLEALLDLMPSNVEAFVAVPNLDQAGDDIDTALLSMDRAGLLVGSRPVDLVKSTLGMGSGVDDFGAGAIALLHRDDGLSAAALFVPVKSPEQFLKTNFRPGEGPTELLQADGTIWWHRAFETHVVVSRDPRAFADFEQPGGVGPSLRDRIGARGWKQLNRRDVLVYARPSALRYLLDEPAAAERSLLLAAVNGVLRSARRLLDQVDVALWSIDVDPLALIVREEVWFRPDSDLGATSDGGPASIDTLEPLADRVHRVSAAFDVVGLGGLPAVAARLDALGLPPPADWFDMVRGAHVGVYSDTPRNGGLLGDTCVILDVDRDLRGGSATVTRAIVDGIRKLGELDDGVARTVTVEPAPEGLGPDVVAFAIEPGPLEAGQSLLDVYFPAAADGRPREVGRLLFEQVAVGLLFGPGGWQGYVGSTGDRVVITLGRRPELWMGAVAAAEGRVESLDENFIVRTMRDWMPASRDVEIYIHPARLIDPIQPLLRQFGDGKPLPLQQLGANLPPIGYAADLQDGVALATLIVPNDYVVLLIDGLVDRLDPRQQAIPDGGP
ncbi:MAG: hypothetical protein ACYTGG_11990 [Planctomycetota bacterium]|jgi:hypothetical protein